MWTTKAAKHGLPPVDGFNLWPDWMALSKADAAAPSLGKPRTLFLATRFGLPGTPYGGTSALVDVRPTNAYKLIRGVVCECPECRPCLMCNASKSGGCVFDVINDPSEGGSRAVTPGSSPS